MAWTSSLSVYCRGGNETEARALAVQLGLPYAESEPCLVCKEDGLYLEYEGMSLHGDFSRSLPRLKGKQVLGEMLVKAVKLRGLEQQTVLDATAGMGEDSLLLAAAGMQVDLYERDQIIASLLRDSLRRAEAMPELCQIIGRMTLHAADSIAAMNGGDLHPDVVLLDPMFPQRQKSGLVKKKFQLLHLLEQPCTDEAELLAAAKAVNPYRIVIKRPLKGPYLAGVTPSYSLKGDAIRYDCLVLRTEQ